MKYSLRNLILLTAVIALILASFANGGMVAVLTKMIVYAFVAAMAILVFVARGERQAFAVGSLIGLAAFLLLVKYGGGNEYDIRYGQLPTTRLLWWMHQRFGIEQDLFNYGQTGQTMFAWLAAMLGGAFAVNCRDKAPEPKKEPVE